MIYHKWQNYFRKSWRIIFPLYFPLYFFSVNSAATTNTYSYFWTASTGASGNISYTGPALGYIRGKVNALYTGSMSVAYNDCSRTDSVMVHYRAEDRWFYVPRVVSIGGHELEIAAPKVPAGFTFLDKGKNYPYIVKQQGPVKVHSQLGKCSSLGYIYPINYTYPSFEMDIDISELSVGSYTGVLPVMLTYAEYFGIKESDIERFDDMTGINYGTYSQIPYNIIITNKCDILSSTSMTLDHGRLSLSEAENNTANGSITLQCDSAASLSVSVSSRSSTPGKSYSDGVGVGLGHGWDSVVQIGNSGLNDFSLTGRTISVQKGVHSIPITSTLRKNDAVSSGSISGNIVISLNMQ